MIRRDRAKQVMIEHVVIETVFFSAVVEIGDVYGICDPFSYTEAYGGYRGAPSFITAEVTEPVDTRLHFANQLDEDVLDYDIRGEDVYTFRPNTKWVQAR